MEKIYILILLTVLQDVFTYPKVGLNIEVITKRNEEGTTLSIPGVVGGRDVIPGQFPHLAAIGFRKDHKTFWLCGGTLINRRFVLTAAHCLQDKDRLYGKALYVRLGDIALKVSADDANAQQFNVVKRIAHPGYKHPMKYNDIGLLKLSGDAIFNDYVKPACLHNTYGIMQTQAEVVGWGQIKPGYYASGQTLLVTDIDLHHIDKCKKIVNTLDLYSQNKYFNDNLQDDSMICAGVLAGGRDACQGDSGGPLQVYSYSSHCRAEVVGIVSFGLGGCGLENVPAIYTRVSHYIPWIKRAISSSY